MQFATTFVLMLAVAPPLRAASEEDAASVFEALYNVYDTAAILETLRVDEALPKVNGPAELSQMKFGSDALVRSLVDPWGTPLHIESIPGQGYVIAAAGSDQRFDRSTWEKVTKTTSSADDIVLRDGQIVRSPEEWALALAPLTPERLKGEQARLKHAQTIGWLRTIILAMRIYEMDAGELPPAGDLEGLVKYLEPKYAAAMPQTDAWGGELDFAMVSTLDGYYLASAGPDGVHDTDDDIVVENHRFTKNEEAPAADRLASSWAGYQAARQRLESPR
jgi:hypothetical protein